MKSRLMAAMLATLVASASAAQHGLTDASFTEKTYASAFTGDVSQLPTPLNQVQMDETKGEWGFIILRAAAILIGASVRAPQPAHAPAPTPVGSCQSRSRNITCN
jgi:hypothetical protein